MTAVKKLNIDRRGFVESLSRSGMSLTDCLETAQEYYENILAAMPGHVYWMDRNGTYLGCNKNLAEMLKLKSPKEMRGKLREDFLTDEITDKLMTIDMEVMESDEPISLEEYGWAPDGRPAVYITNKIPLHDQRGEVVGLLGTSFDISEKKRAEKQLKHAKTLVKKASKAKSEFIANMSHDIRTPFSGIYGLINLLREQEENEEKRLLLGEVAQSAKSLLGFLNQILELTEHDSEEIHCNKAPFDIRYEIDSLIDLMQAKARTQDLDLFVHYDERLPKTLLGDSLRTHRILLNLLSNAIKFTPQGSVTVTARLRLQQLQFAMLELKVVDTGIGIPEDKQQMIFDQFYRLSPANKGLYEGAGLGLWIVKKMLDDVGGTISLKSEENEGAVFTCLIPVEVVDA